MNPSPPDPDRSPSATSPDARKLGNPLDFLQLDHLREREICAILDRIANALAVDPDDVSEVLAFLQEVLPFHLADEEEDLFPLLRKRCEPEDEIDKAIRRLLSDHSHAAEDTPQVIAILERHAAGGCELEDPERMALKQYASHARRHLVLENAIILPLARLRLCDEDLDALRLRMLDRRGLGRLWDKAPVDPPVSEPTSRDESDPDT